MQPAPALPGATLAGCSPALSFRRSFLMNRDTAISYLNSLDRVYVFDGFANWDPEVSDQ